MIGVELLLKAFHPESKTDLENPFLSLTIANKSFDLRAQPLGSSSLATTSGSL
jgi:hypothetical protein